MATADDAAYKKSISQLNTIESAYKRQKKSLDEINVQWNLISNEVFKVSGASFFKDVPKTAGDIKKITDEMGRIAAETDKASKGFLDIVTKGREGEKLFEEISDTFKSINSGMGTAAQKELLRSQSLLLIRDTTKELSGLSETDLKDWATKINSGQKFNSIMLESNQSQRTAIALMSKESQEALNFSQNIEDGAKSQEELRKSINETKQVIDPIGGMFDVIGKRIKQGMVQSIFEMDDIISKTQRDTGIMLKDNSLAFTELTAKAQAFGMSVEQTSEFMGDLSNELQTTDFGVLGQAADDMKAVHAATGLSIKDAASLTGELMRMGESSGQVKDFMQDASKSAQMFGLNSKKVLEDITANLSKMRNMGFSGGEESLKRMVISANKLNMNISEIFDTTSAARTLEGATQMAASLQLASGSFAKIDPLQLLSAARKGPEEMTKILASMGKDIGSFNANGEFQINPIDADRLQIVSEATHQSVDSLTKMIQKNAETTAKLDPFQGMLSGLNDVDKELAKSELSSMLKIGKNGKIEVDAGSDMAKKMGITDLSQINGMNIQTMLEQGKKDAKDLDSQAAANQSLKDSFDNFMKSLMGTLNVFQPILSVLAKALNGFSQMMIGPGKYIAASFLALVGGIMLFRKAGLLVQAGKVISGGGGFTNLVKGFFGGKSSKAQSLMPNAAEGQESKGFMKGLADGLKEFGSPAILKNAAIFAGSMLIIGTAVAAFIYELNLVGGIKSIGELASAAATLVLLGGSIFLLSKFAPNLANITELSLAMVEVSAGILIFAVAANIMNGIDWMQVLKGIGVMALVVGGLMLLGAVLDVGMEFLLVGAAGLIIVGASLLIASVGLLAAGVAFNELASVNWNGLSSMGSTLAGLILPLIGFSAAALVFASPLSIIGMFFMVTALTAVGEVLKPLSESLSVSASSTTQFAAALSSLGDAASKLNLEKLQKLADISAKLANPSSNITAAANAINGGNGGGNITVKIEPISLDLKMNGRVIQHEIINATSSIR